MKAREVDGCDKKLLVLKLFLKSLFQKVLIYYFIYVFQSNLEFISQQKCDAVKHNLS